MVNSDKCLCDVILNVVVNSDKCLCGVILNVVVNLLITIMIHLSQVTLVLRWVDDDLVFHEEFMGLYQVPTITSATLVSVIKDSLIRFNLSINKARGQCYDDASNMTGRRNGVVTQTQNEEPRALFTHCYGHSLNLAALDTVMGCKVLKAVLETTRVSEVNQILSTQRNTVS